MRLIAALAATIAFLLAPISALAAPNDGSVAGSVSNGTAGGASTSGDTVALLVFGVREHAEVDEKTTVVGSDGRYAFTGLDRDPNLAYFLVVSHQNVSYSNPTPFQLKDAATHQADVSVFDTTSGDDTLRFDRVNLLVMGASGGLLQVMEMGSISNAGDRTFVTADPQNGTLAHGVKLGLPKGALNVSMQAGFQDTDVLPWLGGVQVTTPLKPGTQQFALSFQLPYNGSSADLSLQVPYTAGAFSLYAPQDARVDTGALQPGGPAQFGGQNFSLYTAANVPHDTIVGTQLSGLEWAGGAGLSPNQLALISLGVVLFVLGAGLFLYGGRMGRSAPSASGSDAPDVEQERRQLVLRLATLDERFAAGEVPADSYATERARDKERLVELTRVARASS